ncbi:MAG: hypothetical protein PHE16_05435 [Aliarcobacter sp.]|nr:hypothetical protein [Aliarcobacter sp.]
MDEDDFNFVQEVEESSPPPPNDENIVVQKEKTEKKEEPKKEIEEQKFTKKSTGINIDINSAQDFILELQFATQMFNQASEQLKKIEELNKVSDSIAKLQNITIDTSGIEKKFEKEMQELTAKATEIAEKMDINELDEIDSKLVKIQKNFKSYSNFKTFLLVIFVFIAGFLTSHGVDAFNSSYQESHKIVRSFENKGFIFSRTDKNQDVILTPIDAKFEKNKNNEKQYFVYK